MENTSQGNQTVSVSESARLKIIRTRARLVGQKPFFGRLAMMLTPQELKDHPSAGTDGETLYYNPEWIDALTEDELRGVMLHEVLHPALGHLWRQGEREKHRWNYACDYVVNQMLQDNGFTIPKSGLISAKFKGMFSEQVYDKLKFVYLEMCPACGRIGKSQGGDGKDKKDGDGGGEGKDQKDKDGEGHGSGCHVCDTHDKWGDKKENKSAARKMEKMWKAAMVEALKSSKERGDVPAGFERMVEEMEPKEDWKKILASYLSLSTTDFDFMRRDRRFLDADFYLPDLYDETSLEDVVVTVDTSGSISQEMIKRFVAETRGIIKQFGRVKGWLVDCDCEIGEFVELEKGLTKKNWHGGGGTSHVPIFDEIKKRKLSPKVMIAFTDLYTEFPPKEPDFPVIWIVPGAYADSSNPPFGRVIRLKGEF